MKRQGKYGFTFDSKAEEWAAWAKGCLEHNPPADSIAFRRLVVHANDMQMLAAIEGCNRGIKICDSLDVGINAFGQPVPRYVQPPRNRPVPVWPFAAGAAICLTLALVLVEGWI